MPVIWNNKVATLQGLVIMEVYESSIRPEAFGRYIEIGHCSGLAV